MNKVAPFVLYAICVFCFISCSSELDFDQADDIVLSPRVDVNLIFFTVNTENFVNASIPDTTIVVRDTTRLDFLEDSFIRENINQIELSFNVDNSFAQSFSNRAVFLNTNDAPQYILEFEVAPSIDGTLTRTSVVEELSEDELTALLNSVRVANELQINTNGVLIDGTLSLQSKALYSLGISEF